MDEAFKKLQKANHNTVDNLIKWMKDFRNGKLFPSLVVQIKNSKQIASFAKWDVHDVHDLINNISAKIVDGKKVTEEKARQLFADVKDASNVELAKFQEVVSKIADEQKKSLDELSKMLAAEGPKLINTAIAAAKAAAVAAASVFKDAL